MLSKLTIAITAGCTATLAFRAAHWCIAALRQWHGRLYQRLPRYITYTLLATSAILLARDTLRPQDVDVHRLIAHVAHLLRPHVPVIGSCIAACIALLGFWAGRHHSGGQPKHHTCSPAQTTAPAATVVVNNSPPTTLTPTTSAQIHTTGRSASYPQQEEISRLQQQVATVVDSLAGLRTQLAQAITSMMQQQRPDSPTPELLVACTETILARIDDLTDPIDEVFAQPDDSSDAEDTSHCPNADVFAAFSKAKRPMKQPSKATKPAKARPSPPVLERLDEFKGLTMDELYQKLHHEKQELGRLAAAPRYLKEGDHALSLDQLDDKLKQEDAHRRSQVRPPPPPLGPIPEEWKKLPIHELRRRINSLKHVRWLKMKVANGETVVWCDVCNRYHLEGFICTRTQWSQQARRYDGTPVRRGIITTQSPSGDLRIRESSVIDNERLDQDVQTLCEAQRKRDHQKQQMYDIASTIAGQQDIPMTGGEVIPTPLVSESSPSHFLELGPTSAAPS